MLTNVALQNATSGGANSVAVFAHVFTRAVIANETFSALSVMTGAIHSGEADLLIGVSYMRDRRFFIAYSTHTLYVRSAPAAAPLSTFSVAAR